MNLGKEALKQIEDYRQEVAQHTGGKSISPDNVVEDALKIALPIMRARIPLAHETIYARAKRQAGELATQVKRPGVDSATARTIVVQLDELSGELDAGHQRMNPSERSAAAG